MVRVERSLDVAGIESHLIRTSSRSTLNSTGAACAGGGVFERAGWNIQRWTAFTTRKLSSSKGRKMNFGWRRKNGTRCTHRASPPENRDREAIEKRRQ